jgi:hypothetical protein
MNKKVLLWLLENGFNFTNRGVEYLADAICVYHENHEIGFCNLYQNVANKFDVLPHSIERCMRNAIQTQWRKTNFYKYNKRIPNVSEVIRLLELIYFEGDNND